MKKTTRDTPPDWPVQIIRSQKRKKTISAELRNGTLIIHAPGSMSDDQLQPHITSLRQRLQNRERRKSVASSDKDLAIMARELNEKFFSGRLKWESIRYVTNQHKRLGSCTPSTGTIRLSDRLANMPGWVIRYVVMHEMAHLLEANHGKGFWKLVNRYPLSERARGYLMAVGLEELEDQD